jgi:hypothetical protein
MDSTSRWRKLAVTVFAVAALCATHVWGQAVNVPLATGVCIAALGFVSADTLDKAFQSGALGALKK